MVRRTENVVVQTTARLIIPFIQLFGLYVIMHGHSSPGGGFQGGVILGASFILWILAYDLTLVRQRLSEKLNIFYSSLGVIIYGGIGLLCLLWGGNYLDYAKLPLGTVASKTRAFGILGIEIGVGITVMAIMIIVFVSIATHGTEEGSDNTIPFQSRLSGEGS
ncbi:MAG: MnhB domain-containing protein [Planctomycetota bacterium]|nr:MnhB domain-containing protein [Planctomycetota bacterium]